MKTQFSNSLRILALTAVLAGLGWRCFLFHPHSVYAPIHQFAKAGDVMRVAAELDRNPRALNLLDAAGLTPLHLAAAQCHTNVLALLLNRGADANCTAKDNATPLHLAAQEGCVDAVLLLLAKHANVNARDEQGRTPLKRAEAWGQDAIVNLLRERGGAE